MSGDLAAILAKWGNPPKEMIDKLPKPTKRDNPPGKCKECGGWHGLPAVHLDYMGHAAVRRALIETDENWNWEPVALTEQGEPLITNAGGHLRMWIRLTVLGKSVLGVGTCTAGKAEPEKELIGDALRNAAMSLGFGLSLWAKDEWADLTKPEGSGTSSTTGVVGPVERPSAATPPDIFDRIRHADAATKEALKAYAHGKGYTVTPASLGADAAGDLMAWMDRRAGDRAAAHEDGAS